MQTSIGGARLSLVKGDITKQRVDVLVNAANSRLAGGGGVDGAIHAAGGPAIMAECRRLGGCPTGTAVITTAGNLAAKAVIHTVGPIYRNHPEDPKLLAACYRSSMQLAMDHGHRSLAFPGISTGAYGYPLNEAAKLALKTVVDVLQKHAACFDEVRMVLFSQDAYDAYCKAWGAIL